MTPKTPELLLIDSIIHRIRYQCGHRSKNRTIPKDTDEFDWQLLAETAETDMPHQAPDAGLQTNLSINITHATRATGMFSRQNPIVLSVIPNRINQIKDGAVRTAFKIRIRRYPPTHGSKLMAHTKGSGPGWNIRRFRIPPKRLEPNVRHYCNNACKNIPSGREEASRAIPKDYRLEMYHHTGANVSVSE